MRIYVINLDRSADRLAWMAEALGRHGLSFNRVRAIEPHEISLPVGDVTVGENRRGRPWDDAEIACFLSHRECWKRIVADDLAHGIVLEDDIHLCAHASGFLGDLSWLPYDCHLLKLETTLRPALIGAMRYSKGGRTVHDLRSFHFGSAGYIVSGEMARRLLDESANFDVCVDGFLFNPSFGSGRFAPMQLVPALCVQDKFLNPESHRLASLIRPSGRDRGSLPDKKRNTIPERILSEITRPLRRVASRVLRLLRGEKLLVIPFGAVSDP